MEDTLAPGIIYEVFNQYDLAVLRIDNFDRGNYAEIRLELDYPDYHLTVYQLQELTAKLRLIETNEGISIIIVHLDMPHKTLRINIGIPSESEGDKVSGE